MTCHRLAEGFCGDLPPRHPGARMAGFTMIELMVAMLLGLLVIGGVVSVFLANQQVYRTNNALGDVQDSSRMAFEMLAQNIREAGLLGCGNNGQVSNVLNIGPEAGGTTWWADWNSALRGYGSGTTANPALTTGTASGQQVAGTDSLMLLNAADVGLSIASHNAGATTFTLNEVNSGLATGQVMIVCDPDHAAIFRATSYNSSTKTLGYAYGTDATGNCSVGLGYPTICTAVGNAYAFGANSPIVGLAAGVWYIATNPDRSRSLYRADVDTSAGKVTAQEMVRGVNTMDILYHMAGQAKFVAASDVNDWSAVNAVQVHLAMQSTDPRAGVDAAPIAREYTVTSTVRNRVN
jgi:type IV pilus assembly protein PilW